MQTVCCKGVCINVPDTKGVTCHDHVAQTNAFLGSLNLPSEVTGQCDWSTIAEIGETFEVTLDAYSVTFGAFESKVDIVQYLLGYLQSMTRTRVDDRDLADCKLGHFDAKRFGAFADDWTCLGWMTRIGGLLVQIGFQGPGVPSNKVRDELDSMLDSLHLAPPLT